MVFESCLFPKKSLYKNESLHINFDVVILLGITAVWEGSLKVSGIRLLLEHFKYTERKRIASKCS